MATKWNDYDLIPNHSGSVFITDGYLKDLSKYYGTPNNYISSGNVSSAIDATKIDSLIMKNHLKKHIDDYMTQQVKNMIATSSPVHTASNTAQVTDPTSKYPITNKAYTKLSSGYTFPDDLCEISNNVASVNAHLKKLPIYTEQIFIARLENVRPKESNLTDKMKSIGISIGCTLDPWYRNISMNRDKFIMMDSVNYPWIGEHQYQIKVGANHEELLMFWGMKSSIESKPIYIILYTIFKMVYSRRSIKEEHIKLINPHNCSTADNYDRF